MQLRFGEERLDRANDPDAAPDRDQVADLERFRGAQMTGGYRLVCLAKLEAVGESIHG